MAEVVAEVALRMECEHLTTEATVVAGVVKMAVGEVLGY